MRCSLGWIETDMTVYLKEDDFRDFHAEIINRTAVYLASAVSDVVTGQSIPVGGGYSIRQSSFTGPDVPLAPGPR